MQARALWIGGLSCLVAGAVGAGELYGNVYLGSRPLDGVSISVTVNGRDQDSVTSARRGAYRLRLGEPGRGTIRVEYDGRTGETGFYAFDDSIRMNLVLSPSGAGWALRTR